MTMRQVCALFKVVEKAHLVEFYHQTLSYATIQGVKMPTLSEYLSLTLNEMGGDAKAFDEKTDKLLEQKALELFEKRKAKK